MNPVRILNLFTIMDRGGAETMCMNLYRNIDRSKIQFDFLIYYDKKGAYDDEIERLGGHVYRIPPLSPRSLRQHILGARSFLNEHPEYKIVHNHMGSNGALICQEASKAGIQTIIYHYHSAYAPLFHPNPKKILKNFIYSLLYKIARFSCKNSFACGQKAAVDSGVKDVVVLHNAIHLEKFQYEPEKRAEIRRTQNLENAFVLGNVARFDFMKNHKFLLEVFRAILKREPSALLLLAGDGSLRNELKETTRQTGIADKVKFLGVRDDIPELLQAMDVFVFPSIREGLPVSCIEAQAAGLPCVFSDSFDHETAVTESCRFLSLNDPVEKWVEAILSFKDFKREDTSYTIRAAGYDIKETSKKMQDFYLEMSKK